MRSASGRGGDVDNCLLTGVDRMMLLRHSRIYARITSVPQYDADLPCVDTALSARHLNVGDHANTHASVRADTRGHLGTIE
jgi:hypothetical protein